MPNENVTDGVRCKATVYFYTDKMEKPEVILEGVWSGRDIVRSGSLLQKAYRFRIRDLQREGKLASEEVIKAESELGELNEGSAEEEETPPTTNIEEGKE